MKKERDRKETFKKRILSEISVFIRKIQDCVEHVDRKSISGSDIRTNLVKSRESMRDVIISMKGLEWDQRLKKAVENREKSKKRILSDISAIIRKINDYAKLVGKSPIFTDEMRTNLIEARRNLRPALRYIREAFSDQSFGELIDAMSWS